MYDQKQIVSDIEGINKGYILNFIPVQNGIGLNTFVYNIATLFSKEKKLKILLIDLDKKLLASFNEEKIINNVSVLINNKYDNLYYFNNILLKKKIEERDLLGYLKEELDIDYIIVKNKNIEDIKFNVINEDKVINKKILLTDSDSDNLLKLYKSLVFNRINNEGIILLKYKESDNFKVKKLENLLEIKNYSKILYKSYYYNIIDYMKDKTTDLFEDVNSINETKIYLEYKNAINVLLGKPVEGVNIWAKKKY